MCLDSNLKAKITFDETNKLFYRTGETVTGYTDVSIREPLVDVSMHIFCIGELKYYNTCGAPLGNLVNGYFSKEFLFESEPYFTHEIMYGDKSSRLEKKPVSVQNYSWLAAGIHRRRFAFKLPESLPASTNKISEGLLPHIVYHIGVTCSYGSSSLVPVNQVEFFVLPNVPILYPIEQLFMEHNHTKGLKISLDIPRIVKTNHGTAIIPVNLSIDNRKLRTVRGLKVKLLQTRRLGVAGRHTTKIATRIDGDIINKFQEESLRTQFNILVCCNVFKLLPTHEYRTVKDSKSPWSITYRLEFSFHMNTCTRDIHFQVPLTIIA